MLHIDHNDIQDIPVEIGNLQKLEELILSYNKIKTIPEALCYLQNLKVLEVNHNDIQDIPVEIGNLQKLQELSVMFNKIKVISVELGNLPNIKRLWFRGNLLSYENQRELNRLKRPGLDLFF
jgi:Leucine-rich repeat (LRR) protein